jgi:hypothetical protein
VTNSGYILLAPDDDDDDDECRAPSEMRIARGRHIVQRKADLCNAKPAAISVDYVTGYFTYIIFIYFLY